MKNNKNPAHRCKNLPIEIGIKSGLQNWSSTDWDKVQADFVELHFRIDQAEQYVPIIKHLQARGLEVALHFWAVLPDDILPTFSVTDTTICDKTMNLLSDCLHFASTYKCIYVVYHPGPRRICKLSLATGLFSVTSEETPAFLSRQIFLSNARQMEKLASDLGIELIIETETRRKPTWCFNETYVGASLDAGDQTLDTLAEIGKEGIPLCIDMAHLATWYAETYKSREQILNKIIHYTNQLGASVKLIHLAGLLPPYIVDTTTGLTPKEISAGAFPNENEVVRMLCEIYLSKGRLRVVPEPRMKDHLWHNLLLNKIKNNPHLYLSGLSLNHP